MCFAAIALVRFRKVYYGLEDKKFGAFFRPNYERGLLIASVETQSLRRR